MSGKKIKPRRVSGIDLPKSLAAGSLPVRGATTPTVVTAKTKVTVAPPFVDRRLYVDPDHRGEFSAEWKRLRGEVPE